MHDITEILNKVKNNIGSSFFYTPYKNEDSKSFIFGTPQESISCKNPEEI